MADKPFLTKFKEVIDQTDLSVLSKNSYKYRLERLVTLTNKDVDWILVNCKKTLQILKKNNIVQPQTVKSMMNAVLTLFKHTKGLKERKTKAFTCWIEHFKEVNEKAQEKYEKIEASKRQIDAYVSWDKIIETREQLDKTSQEYFILCLYTMMPPARADFNKVRIIKDNKLTEAFVKEFPNHLVLMPTGMRLVYNEFKTRSKKMQVYDEILPYELVNVIKDSLKNQPREFLVVSRTGEPYHKPNSFTQHVKRVLQKVFNKNMSINTLRHSFVNSVDMNKITPMEKNRYSKLMMHSPAMFDRYRLIIPAEKSDNGKKKICDAKLHLICKDA
jgi:hypothetical protein